MALNKPWNLQLESLVDNIKFDHGYTAKSPVIMNVSSFILICYISYIHPIVVFEKCGSLILALVCSYSKFCQNSPLSSSMRSASL